VKFGNEKKKSVLTDNADNNVPGPGAYSNKEKMTASKTQTYSFGKEKKTKKIEASPGPGEYLMEQSSFNFNKTAKTNWTSMGKMNREIKFTSNEDTPGPGNYSTKQKDLNGPKYSIGKKTDATNKHPTPGPGEYIYENAHTTKKSQGSKIGNSTRGEVVADRTKSDNPGPGMYNSHKTKPQDKTFKFGGEARFKGPKDVSPGPGQYYIPCSVVDVPEYMTIGATFDRTFKFV